MVRILEEEIEILRTALVNMANTEKLTSQETLEFSRKLDNLINQYIQQCNSD